MTAAAVQPITPPSAPSLLERERELLDSLPENAAKIVEELQREMIRAHRYGRPMSCVMFGVDLRDAVGKNVGAERRTQLLRRIQNRAGTVLRQSDYFGRVDDSAVLVVLPETDEVGAEIVAQKLLAGGNTPNLIGQSAKFFDRVFVSWRELEIDDCNIARFLDMMRDIGLDFAEFARRPMATFSG